jgi:hypothetical protein
MGPHSGPDSAYSGPSGRSTPPSLPSRSTAAVDVEQSIVTIATRAGELHEAATPDVRVAGAIARIHTKRLLDTKHAHLERLAAYLDTRSIDELARHANAGTAPHYAPPTTSAAAEVVEPIDQDRIAHLLATAREQGRHELEHGIAS